MRALSLLVFVCAGLGVSFVSVRLGDRQTLVPPPEARVEAFLRELHTRRSQLAVRYLTGELRRHISASGLQHAFGGVEAAIGDVGNVDAATLSWDRQSARVRGELVSANGRRTVLDFGLKWERGEWTIEVLPEALWAAPRGRAQD
jgi:hypothetical protein